MQTRSNSSPAVNVYLDLQELIPWALMLGLALFSTLCLLVGASNLLRLAFPVLAFMVGAVLYWRHPLHYLSFTWWMWFLTPFVRRLIDYQSGWMDPNPVLLTPFLVTSVTGITFLRYSAVSTRQGGLPFVLASAGILYGLGIGLLSNTFTSVVTHLLNWLIPVLFGFYLFINWKDYPRYRQNIQRNFLWGVLVMGSYGVLQFISAPAWDGYWMVNSEMGVIGTPEPFMIRVFSTMNSPGPFGVWMMAGLLLLFSSKNPLRLPAASAGYLAFLLASSRTAWLGWGVGMLTFLTSLKLRLQVRLIITILVISVCVIPLVTLEPFAGVIQSRFETFLVLKDDESYNDRTAGYGEALGEALSEVLGRGIGYVQQTYSIGSHDSAILEMLFALGWIGNIPYLGGLAMLLFNLLPRSEIRDDAFAGATRAISFGMFIQVVLGSVIIAASGVAFWGFAGMAMAARKYHQHYSEAEEGS